MNHIKAPTTFSCARTNQKPRNPTYRRLACHVKRHFVNLRDEPFVSLATFFSANGLEGRVIAVNRKLSRYGEPQLPNGFHWKHFKWWGSNEPRPRSFTCELARTHGRFGNMFNMRFGVPRGPSISFAQYTPTPLARRCYFVSLLGCRGWNCAWPLKNPDDGLE